MDQKEEDKALGKRVEYCRPQRYGYGMDRFPISGYLVKLREKMSRSCSVWVRTRIGRDERLGRGEECEEAASGAIWFDFIVVVVVVVCFYGIYIIEFIVRFGDKVNRSCSKRVRTEGSGGMQWFLV